MRETVVIAVVVFIFGWGIYLLDHNAESDLREILYQKNICLNFQRDYQLILPSAPTKLIEDRINKCKAIGACAEGGVK
jgi:hypothetical protein